MLTTATVCDGDVECANGEDEGWLCTESRIPFYGVLGSCCLVLSIVLAFKCLRERKYGKLKQNEGTKENPSLLSTKLDGEMFLENHDNKSFKEKMNVVLLRNKFLNEKSIRIEENTKYYNLELEKHNGSIAEMRCCIKNYLDPAIFKTVIEDKEPGIIRRCFPWIETAVEKDGFVG